VLIQAGWAKRVTDPQAPQVPQISPHHTDVPFFETPTWDIVRGSFSGQPHIRRRHLSETTLYGFVPSDSSCPFEVAESFRNMLKQDAAKAEANAAARGRVD
jgi:hypothetical protein